jgi:membrane-associated phospholipid phosphatase
MPRVPPNRTIRRVRSMALINVRPTALDRKVADAVAVDTDPRIERAAEALTWGADEHVLIAAAALGFLLTRASQQPVRRFGTHVLACSLCTALLPHILKSFINQQRPDRRTLTGHWHGAPFSGKAEDAFPSGHALHVGALASAATLLPSRPRNWVWAAGGVLVATRVVLLAHWVTDVLAGLGLGVAVERAIRPFTRPVPIDERGQGPGQR